MIASLALGCSTGLADGVGSWIEAGVDAGIFARELMGNCKAAALNIPPSKSAPITILKNGFYDTTKTVGQFSHKDTCDTSSPLWPF
jgi:hypothetical protein